MTEPTAPAFEPVTYLLPQSRLRRVARRGMRRSFSGFFVLTWVWIAVYIAALASFSVFSDEIVRFLRRTVVPMGVSVDAAVGILMAGLVAIFVAGLIFQRRLFRRELEQRINTTNEVVLAPIAGGVRIGSEAIEHHLRWAAIDQVLIEPDGLALVHGALFFFVPAAAFPSDQAFQAFRDYIIANMKPAALERSRKELRRV